ncbi:14485_t:CDS:2 [Funneliformis caledonium]|uniref:14485_t:CDS:1 n=1 Tax=Funneliformis caledonium TaxID=1117310 RepID=A0A9N9CY58_9GLOM|nr:14485_t:CDS:2 [Funneliformis caledonium]
MNIYNFENQSESYEPFFQEYEPFISIPDFITNERNEYYSEDTPDDFVDSYQEISNDATILTCIKIASEDISLDTTFLSWNEVEDFFEDYGY